MGSSVTSKNLDLLTESGHLQLQLHASSEAGKEAVENGNDDPALVLDAAAIPLEKRGFLRRMGFVEGTASRAAGDEPVLGARRSSLTSSPWSARRLSLSVIARQAAIPRVLHAPTPRVSKAIAFSPSFAGPTIARDPPRH